MRFAFLTSEFIIEKPDGGGLGNYVNRITKILKEQGHQVEIFVTRLYKTTPEILNYGGITVYHVPYPQGLFYKFLRMLDRYVLHTPYGGLSYRFGLTVTMAKALARRESEVPFDVVHSTSLAAVGLFVKTKNTRFHITRISSIIKQCLIEDRCYNSIGARILVFLELLALKRANLVYAPSFFTSRNYEGLGKKKVHVLRPPIFIESTSISYFSAELPKRYFIHFGSIGPLKGSDVIAEALIKVWVECPDFMMVWVGKERNAGEMAKYQKLWGQQKENVIWFNGLQKSDLYTVLKKAEVSVLPSRVDNLPNTVIESLFLGIPVIGTKGTSIDELVEEGNSGALTEIGDIEGLSDVLVKAWKKDKTWQPDGFIMPLELEKFKPLIAAQNLVDLINAQK